MHINEIRKELKFNTELVQLIETLKNIAAAQYQLMEKKKQRFYEFMEAFDGFFRVVSLVDVMNPLVRAASDILGIVVLTSDSGFMGGLNQGVVRAALQVQGNLEDDKTALVVIGDKGALAFDAMGRQFKFFPGIHPETLYEQSLEVRDYLVGEVLAGHMGRAVVVYPKPLSFTAQTVEVLRLLPCAELFKVRSRGETGPVQPTPRSLRTRLAERARRVIVESSFADIAEYLATLWVSAKLFEVFEDSKLAEFSARAVHLEGSQQKLQQQQRKIRQMFFKAVHE
ncbi:MAG: F0F1 ATP synthase subunit gamma, partial [Kiritimatiellia bacterium]